MRRAVACFGLASLACCTLSYCQQVGMATPVAGPIAVSGAANPDATVVGSGKVRVFITDSDSWSTQGGAGGAHGVFGAHSSGGARPQTAEIIKTFGQRCPQVIVNNHLEASNYVVELDHEGGKGLLAHKDKIAVFVQKSGDSIFSKSTLSLGGSVQDACTALLAHWNAHASELSAPATPAGGVALAGSAATAQLSALSSSSAVAVNADVPNCDIEVDGSFMGSTPSTLSLSPGKHVLVVKKSGYQEWSRTMLVASGVVRVEAEMVKQ